MPLLGIMKQVRLASVHRVLKQASSCTEYAMGTLTSQRPELGLAAELELLEMTHARKFTREEFYTMVDAGIFDDDYKVELIDGRIVTEMAPIGGERGWSVDNLTRLLVGTLLDTDLIVRVQSGVSFPGDRELQPDFAVYRRLPETRSNPGPSQILLVVEFATVRCART